jgi:hypothetical protein
MVNGFPIQPPAIDQCRNGSGYKKDEDNGGDDMQWICKTCHFIVPFVQLPAATYHPSS